MAAFLSTCLQRSSRLSSLALQKSCIPINQIRTVVYKESGAILENPKKVQWKLVKIAAVTIPSISFGAWVGMMGAQYLEELEIFVPQDDDD